MPVKVDFIDALLLANSTASSSAAPVEIKFIVGCNGNNFYGGFGSWAQSATGAYDDTAKEISTVAASQNWYLADGTRLLVVSGSTGAHTSISTGGTGQPPSKARLVSLYRNRLVLGRTVSDPQNLFFSKVGDYTDFDIDDQTSIGAFDMNHPLMAGKVGDVVTAFIAYSDDHAIIGCSDSVHILRGDPRAGGNVDALIRGGGIVGQWAWAHDPEGRVYYMSRRDLMVIQPGSLPTSLSQGRLQRFLSSIDYSTFTVRMAWDIIAKGLWIFFCPLTQQAAAPVHLFWDARMDAFLPMQFPAEFGPTALRSLNGETYLERQLVLGSFPGTLRTLSQNWITDSGTAINSYAQFSPLALADEGNRGMITETEIVLGDVQPSHCHIEWYAGDNAQVAIEAATSATEPAISHETEETGRVLIRQRARGQVGVLRISNSDQAKRWAFDSGIAVVRPAGRTR